MKKSSNLVIRRGSQIASAFRLQHGDVRYLKDNGVVRGSYTFDTLDSLLEKETIDQRQHDNARKWYRDYYLTQDQLKAISYENEYGLPLVQDDFLAEAEIRYKQVLRRMPLGTPTLPVSICICLDGMSLRQTMSNVRKGHKTVLEALICGLEILEDIYG